MGMRSLCLFSQERQRALAPGSGVAGHFRRRRLRGRRRGGSQALAQAALAMRCKKRKNLRLGKETPRGLRGVSFPPAGVRTRRQGRASCRRPETITLSAHGLDVVLAGAKPVQLLAHSGHADLDVVQAPIDGRVPHPVVQLLIGEHLAWVAGQEGEKIELQGGEGCRMALVAHLPQPPNPPPARQSAEPRQPPPGAAARS